MAPDRTGKTAKATDTVELPIQDQPASAPGGTGTATSPQVASFRPSTAGWAARVFVAAALVAGVYALPAIVPFDFQADLITRAAIYAMVALSMNVLTGYLGQLSLGHQAFFGIGAFVSASLVTSVGLPFAAGVVAGGLTGAAAALVLGGVALRVRGLYLAIVTLAYGLLAENSLFLIRPLTGGGAGVPADLPEGFSTPRAYAYLCLGVLTVLFLFDWRLLKSKAGRAIQAIRDDERVAASFGINITGYKLLAFVLSGTYAGVAGALFGHALGNVVSAPFNLLLALTFVLMTVVGGLGNRVGVMLGGAFFALIGTILEGVYGYVVVPIAGLAGLELAGTPDPVVGPVVGALLVVGVLVLYPGGFGQPIQPIQRWIRGGRFDLRAVREQPSAMGGGIVGRP